jgi:hypothetical protein
MTVISLSAQSELLTHREAALRSCGYEVLSTTSEIEVRIEVEMGRWGVLLLCYTLHQTIHEELSGLFMRSCPVGVVAFVMHPARREESPHAHICLLDSDFPHRLHLIKMRVTGIRRVHERRAIFMKSFGIRSSSATRPCRVTIIVLAFVGLTF